MDHPDHLSPKKEQNIECKQIAENLNKQLRNVKMADGCKQTADGSKQIANISKQTADECKQIANISKQTGKEIAENVNKQLKM